MSITNKDSNTGETPTAPPIDEAVALSTAPLAEAPSSSSIEGGNANALSALAANSDAEKEPGPDGSSSASNGGKEAISIKDIKADGSLPSGTVANGTSNVATGFQVTTSVAPVKTEEDADDEPDDGIDAESIKSEGAEEEDALFSNLEQEEEKEEAIHPHHQPKDVSAAPVLLQRAIQEGELKEDSDTEEKKGEHRMESNVKESDDKTMEDESDHHHQRVRSLLRLVLVLPAILS
jgi:hypothetical protein